MGNNAAKQHIHHQQNSREKPKKYVHWKSAERPGAPGRPTANIPSTEEPDVCQLKWDKPKTDGGSPILGYVVEFRPVGYPNWVRGLPILVPKCNVSLSGLEMGWRYQFRIIAENVVGKSDPSELSDILTVSRYNESILVPKFVKELTDTTVVENERIEIRVSVVGSPPPEICWFKDGYEIYSSRRTKIINENDTSILIIHQVSLTDEGEIRCTATNKAGHVVTRAILKVEAPPKIRLPRQYEDGMIIEAEDTLRLKVGIAGQPPPTVVWSHEGHVLRNGGRFELETIEKSSSLKITSVKRTDRGEYSLRAINKLGDDQAFVMVNVTSRPSPPGKVKLSMSFGKSTRLTWSAPDDDGGCKIGNYIVEYFRIGWNVWLKASTTRQLTTTLHDLIEGSEYKFRVKAENPYGVSEPSEESEGLFIPDPRRTASQVKEESYENIPEVKPPIPPKRKNLLSFPNFFTREKSASPERESSPRRQKSPNIAIGDSQRPQIYESETLSLEMSYGTPIDQLDPKDPKRSPTMKRGSRDSVKSDSSGRKKLTLDDPKRSPSPMRRKDSIKEMISNVVERLSPKPGRKKVTEEKSSPQPERKDQSASNDIKVQENLKQNQKPVEPSLKDDSIPGQMIRPRSNTGMSTILKPTPPIQKATTASSTPSIPNVVEKQKNLQVSFKLDHEDPRQNNNAPDVVPKRSRSPQPNPVIQITAPDAFHYEPKMEPPPLPIKTLKKSEHAQPSKPMKLTHPTKPVQPQSTPSPTKPGYPMQPVQTPPPLSSPLQFSPSQKSPQSTPSPTKPGYPMQPVQTPPPLSSPLQFSPSSSPSQKSPQSTPSPTKPGYPMQPVQTPPPLSSPLQFSPSQKSPQSTPSPTKPGYPMQPVQTPPPLSSPLQFSPPSSPSQKSPQLTPSPSPPSSSPLQRSPHSLSLQSSPSSSTAQPSSSSWSTQPSQPASLQQPKQPSKPSQSPKDNHEMVHNSSEFVLVLYHNKNNKSKETEKQESFDLELEEALSPPPLSLSSPELATEPDMLQQGLLRRSYSSTELLYERAMARFYEAVELEESERAKGHKVSQDANVSGSVVTRKRLGSMGEAERLSFERRSAIRKRLSAEIPENLAVNLQSRLTSGDNLRHPGWHEQLSTESEPPTKKLNQQISEEKEFSDYEQEQAKYDEEYSDEERQSQRKRTEYEDDYTDSTASSDDSIEKFKIEIMARTRSASGELQTYHPHAMSNNSFVPYRSPPPDQSSVVLTKPVPLPDPDFIPKPILKRPSFESVEKFDIKEPEKSQADSPVTSDKEKVLVSTEKLDPEKEKLEENKENGSPRNRLIAFFKKDRTPSDQNLVKSDEALNFKNGKPNGTPATTQNQVTNGKTATTESTKKEPEVRRLSASEELRKKKLESRRTSEEETRVVVDHYSDIVRELGRTRKSNVPIYLSSDELRKVEEKAYEEEQKVLSAQKLDDLTSSEELLIERAKAQHRLSLVERMQISHVKAKSDLAMVIKEESESFNEKPKSDEDLKSSVSGDQLHRTLSGETSSTSKMGPKQLSKRFDHKKPLKNTSESSANTKMNDAPLGGSPLNRSRTRVTSKNTTPTSKSLEPEIIPSTLSLKTSSHKGRQAYNKTLLSTEHKSKSSDDLLEEAKADVHSTITYVTDVGLFLVACWIYLFKNALLVVPILILLVYRHLKDAVKNHIPNWMKRKKS